MQEKTKNILLGVLIVGLVAMTVAYAALTTNLSISGTATVAEAKWNIRLEDFAKDTTNTTAGVTATTGTSSDSTNITKIENFTATLNQPGDKVVYTFKIANRGTIDATKASFSKHISVARKTGTNTYDTAATNSTHINDYTAVTVDGVEYNVTCSNDTTLTANAANPSSATPATCTLTIEYLSNMAGVEGNQSSTTAGTDQTANIPERKVTVDAAWQYIQAS